MLKRNLLAQTELAERVGEAFALQVLSEHFGAEVLIGSSIENKLSELAHVIYQDVPDKHYFGASTIFETGEMFVALNTYQPLRIRYFTGAHELWHVLNIKEMIDKDIDQERAADRFAAALMMPAPIIRLLWDNFIKKVTPEKAVIMIADMTSAPYEAVARRVDELKLPKIKSLKIHTEEKWIELRKNFNLPNSPLDSSFKFTSFTDYEITIEKEVENGELTLFEAATKLSKLSFEKAKKLQEKALSEYAVESDDEEEDID